MKAINLSINPFECIEILDCKMEKGLNIHGYAWIKAVIAAEKEDEYLHLATSHENVEITAIDINGNRETIFCGILEDFKIDVLNGLKVMEMRLAPHTRLLDMMPEICAFQNKNMSFEQVLRSKLANYNDSDVLMNVGQATPIGRFYVQYNETDWEFMKRMAATFQDVLVPNYLSHGTKVYFGAKAINGGGMFLPDEFSPISYEIKKYMGEYNHKKQNNVLLSENDATYYIVKDREVRKICDNARFKGKTFMISHIRSTWEKQELVHFYTLKSPEGCKVPYASSPKIIGASMSGKISAVSGDQVKVALNQEGSVSTSNAKWFAYSTVYSSPDGSGWYAMPEIGDEIRLYFPTEVENEGYVISSVHVSQDTQEGLNSMLPQENRLSLSDSQGMSPPRSASAAPAASSSRNSGGGARSNPDNKSLLNKYGKKVELTPNSIILSTGSGLDIIMDDDSGIQIISSSDIEICAAGDLSIISTDSTVTAVGKEKIVLEQESTSIKLEDEKITFEGAQVVAQ